MFWSEIFLEKGKNATTQKCYRCRSVAKIFRVIGLVRELLIPTSLVDYHIVEIEGFGAVKADGTRFQVHTIRKNPSKIGEVTGFATFAAFLGSLQNAVAKGPGIHLC
ncbi:UNVERIFIED_CONTAM: Aspdh [Trichonephila clavipes]